MSEGSSGAGSKRVAISREGADELRYLAFRLDSSYTEAKAANAALLTAVMPLLQVDIEFMKEIRNCVADSVEQLNASAESITDLTKALCGLADKIEDFLQRMASPAGSSASGSEAANAADVHMEDDPVAHLPELFFDVAVKSDGDDDEPPEVPAYTGAPVFDHHGNDEEMYDLANIGKDYWLEAVPKSGREDTVSARSVVGARFFDDEGMTEDAFWMKPGGAGSSAAEAYARYGELASHVPEVAKRMSKGETLESLASDPVLGQTAQSFFAKERRIRVVEKNGRYFLSPAEANAGDAAQRLCIAQDMGLNIPVLVTHYMHRK
ncbi:Uncharacterised protein [Slackia heliotrinireducens]|uniref:Uncharacterized protein n=1 Tax=Slackia heliotrinireducens (strain ATCC 29202 / DSM 20476 / NCTC 11029 / RHS 1) TaxID=471855 RepID=C7N2F2_SLAHD|nr:hypothetical protein [Slackia heliotrinireducens]ACV21458.1 hypothetical protein Shel_03970 [Slackia heliotrinireducens DSM 20476]VEG98897.1 Uncharacterised protein [Slackia heliotrinireducens]